MSAHDHPHKSAAPSRLTFKVLTVSSSRAVGQDLSGDLIERLVREAGHQVQERRVVPDDPDLIRRAVQQMLEDDPHVLVTTGGTGVTPKDVTVEAVRPLLDKELGAFSILFAQLSYQQVGPAALLSRALAGIVGQSAVFCLPGSPKACSLALERLILAEAPHLMAHVRGLA